MLIYENMHMEFCRPEKSWTAVVRGAVVCGIEKVGNRGIKYATSCRHSYAICLDEIYMSELHAGQEKMQIGNSTFAHLQLTWLLNKDDLVLSDTPRKVQYTFELRLVKLRQEKLKLKIWRNLSGEKHRPTQLSNARDGT
jgi:hypothetical protein